MTGPRDGAEADARGIGPPLVAIVVNYGTPTFTIACVESLLRLEGVRAHVIVVDNASRDDSVARLNERFTDVPSVTLYPRERNDGYAGGNNAGVALAQQMGARSVFLLNSDTVVDAQCVRHLVAEMSLDTRVAVACPRIFFGEPADRLWFGGGRFSLWTGRNAHVGWRRPAADGWTSRRDLPFATGCALLVRLDAVAGPLFDATLFSYAEDLDLSLRLRQAGHRLRYVPEAIVWHYEGASHRRAGGQALRFYFGTRNLLRVVARHARWYHWATLAPMLAIDVVGRYCATALRDRDFRGLAAVLRGVWHAMSGGRHPIERDAPRSAAG